VADINVTGLGLRGVNVDKNPLELDDNDLIQAQNGISDPAAGNASVRKRPGLVAFTTTSTSGNVLGGIGVPLQHLLSGTHFIYIGRGTE